MRSAASMRSASSASVALDSYVVMEMMQGAVIGYLIICRQNAVVQNIRAAELNLCCGFCAPSFALCHTCLPTSCSAQHRGAVGPPAHRPKRISTDHAASREIAA